jgi:tripartite-type tricarboxylate transporter receptor subunit TctC
MKLPRRHFLHLAAGAAALPAVSHLAWAQAYPTRPVRIVAATAPGGLPDILARLMGQWLSERLGQQFIIDNRPGGGSNIGTEAVVRAPPDGYTLLLVSTTNAINEASAWAGFGAPKNTPADIVDKLNKEINAGLADPKMKARLADLGGAVLPGSPADFAKLIAEEIEKWGKVIRDAKIKPD